MKNARNMISRLIAKPLSVLFILAASTPLAAQPVYAEPSPRIVVNGQGSVDIAPDMAVLTLSVTRQAPTAKEAVAENSQAMEGVLKAMRAQGIADRDLQTAGFSIAPQYTHLQRYGEKKGSTRKFSGYLVRNTLTVRVRDIAKVGQVLDTSISLGVNEGGNILFTNDDPTDVLAKARANGVAAAKAKALTLAKAAGVRLGKVLEISEQSYGSGPRPMARAEMAMSRSADAVPISSGENTYQVTVYLTYAIEQ